MPKLTMEAVRGLQKPAKGQTFLWDSELRGFGVRAIPSGLKTFVLQYRNAEDRSRRITLGRFGVMTVEQARLAARVNLGDIAKGVDPADLRSGSDKNTIGEVCDWYIAEAESGRLLGRNNRAIKASTLSMDRSRIEMHIKPLLGNRQVKALKSADIAGMQADIAAGKTARARADGRGGVTRGGPGVAARTLTTLQGLLSHAKRMDVIAANPALGVRKIAGKRKDRRLSVEEICRLGDAMRRSPEWAESPVALAAVELMLLTGFRISEAQELQRSWVDTEKRFVRFPDTKTGGQVRAIGPSAASLIAHRTAKSGSPYVFPSEVGDGPYTAAKRCLGRLCFNAQLTAVTPHTLRHTFASIAGDLGFSELTIAALLGHSARGVTQGYVHIDEALKLAAERTCEEIARLLQIEVAI